MSKSTDARSINYPTGNADVLADLGEEQKPMFITPNGVAKAVIPDVASSEQTQETFALLKALAPGTQDIEAGRTRPERLIVDRLRAQM